MTLRYGTDTPVLVRLLTGLPPEQYEDCLGKLTRLTQQEDAEILASNQVIGEAYIAVQHHYGVTGTEARMALSKVLASGLIAPLGGQPVLAALRETAGPGLMDRLILEEYSRTGMETLTLDRRMATLPGARRL